MIFFYDHRWQFKFFPGSLIILTDPELKSFFFIRSVSIVNPLPSVEHNQNNEQVQVVSLT